MSFAHRGGGSPNQAMHPLRRTTRDQRAAGVDNDLAKMLTTAAPLHPSVLAFLWSEIRARAHRSGARVRNR
ncbi:MAG: hypothetical protein ACKN9U_07035, partial [Pirellulaceae bacterium]